MRIFSLFKKLPRAASKFLCATGIGLAMALTAMMAPTAAAETLTNDDVIKLVKAGLSSDTISLSIRSASATKFDTSASGLAELGQEGVPDSVLQAMIKRSSQAAAPAAAAAPAPAAAPARSSLKSNRRSVQPPNIKPVVGKQYFTRYNLWYERSKSATTNYSRGNLLPINSKVTLESIGEKKMVLGLESGESVTVVLVKKFSQRPLEEIAVELLAGKEIPISRLGKELSRSISQGTMRLGMTREQVLMTRGYPPRHKTPSLDNDRWVYWSSRFVYRTLVFKDGLLVQGRGIN